MDFEITTARPAGPRPAAPVAAGQAGAGGTHAAGSAHQTGASGPSGAGGAPAPPPVAPEDIPASIFVAGVSPAVNDDTLREFLECCGPLRSLSQFGETPTAGQPRQYVATYADADAAQSSLVLHNMTLVDRPITVVAASTAIKPGGSLDLSKGGSAAVPSGADLLNPLASMEQAVMTGLVEDPLKLWRQAADKLPKWFPAGYKRCALFVPIPHLINGAMAAAEQRIEFEKEHRESGGNFIDDSDVARTVYAGNVNSSITEDMLADFFSIAGNVTYVKFAGSEFNPSRFGFVEFDTKAAAESAKALSGTQVAEMTLKVKHSNNPIVKDRMRNFWGRAGRNGEGGCERSGVVLSVRSGSCSTPGGARVSRREQLVELEWGGEAAKAKAAARAGGSESRQGPERQGCGRGRWRERSEIER
jgi:arginine/serine-rich splicing factor 12